MISNLDEIRTLRCRVAPLRAEDASAFQVLSAADTPDRSRFLPGPLTIEGARALIDGGDDGRRFLGVWDVRAQRLVGLVVLEWRGEQETEIGYWFAPVARGRGLAAEVMTSLVAALGILDPDHRIVAECGADNARSWRLLEWLGFETTGRRGALPGGVLLSWSLRSDTRIDVC